MMKLVQKIAVGYIRGKFRILSAVSPLKTAEQALKLFSTPQRRTKGPLPAVFSTAEKLYFTFEHYQIRGFRWNKGAAKRALVIHGFESSMINFDKYIQGLLDKGYEVLAFDAPAHGRSSGKRVNALQYCNFIQHVCRQHGPMDAFIAHSLGGLALCMALAEMGTKTRTRIALIAPATETETLVNQFFQFIRLKRPEIREEFEKIIIRVGGQPTAWFSIGRTLDYFDADILWIHDEDDKITPIEDALKIRDSQRPNIRFKITQKLGHNKIYRDTAVRNTVLDFFAPYQENHS
jgi:pimeloyl-ACP methyl ester carboxylesterase